MSFQVAVHALLDALNSFAVDIRKPDHVAKQGPVGINARRVGLEINPVEFTPDDLVFQILRRSVPAPGA